MVRWLEHTLLFFRGLEFNSEHTQPPVALTPSALDASGLHRHEHLCIHTPTNNQKQKNIKK